MSRHLLAALVASIATLAGGASAAAQTPPTPTTLRVLGGEEAWHAENDFELRWDEVASPPSSIVAVHCRVRDVSGVIVSGVRIPWRVNLIERVPVPPAPGHYRAEVWLENVLGEIGAPASVGLRFDNGRPGLVEPSLPPGWLGADSAPLLTIGRPAGALPLSGIRGYAISHDSSPDGSPCTGERCSADETDLRAGLTGDSVRLGRMPEGTNYVHAVAVSGSGMRSSSVGTTIARIDATPPAVRLSGVPDGWASGPVTVVAKASDALSGMAAEGSTGPGSFTALAVDGAVPTVAGGDSVGVTVSGEGVHRLDYHARDAAGNLGVDRSGPAIATVRIDRSPPRVAFATSLDAADPELLEARVSDELSGPDHARGSIAVRPARSRAQFTPLPTTVSGARLLARWDSDRYPPGTYEFRATGYDKAGNEGSGQRRANGTMLVLPAPLKAPTELRAGFGGKRLVWHRCRRAGQGRRCRREVLESFERRPSARTVPYGRGIAVGGLLTSATGLPLPRQPVQVIEIFDAGGRPERRVRTLESGSDGSFFAQLEPGPNRRIEFSFAGSRTLAAASGLELELAMQAGIRLRASAATAAVSGRPLIFSGAVEDPAAIPPGGKSVEMQFRLPGLPWAQFRTIRTDARGRFRYTYRFSDDDSRGVRFQFRAFVPAEAGWPYDPAASSPVTVTGR